MPSRSLYIGLFTASLTTALALGAALSHALELPNKIDLPRDAYFTVQQIYRGWSQLGWLLLLQLLSIVAVIVLSRRTPRIRRLAVVALVCLLGAQAVFWACTQPANVATVSWTVQPESWPDLRRQWEYSHAVGAALQVGAMAALVGAALRFGEARSDGARP